MRYSSRAHYRCPRCGYVTLTEEAADDFEGEKFSESEKLAISIALRNNWERAGRPQTGKVLTLDDLHRIVEQSRPLSPTEKMDQALLQFERQTAYVGSDFLVDFENDYPLYYCREPREISSICGLLIQAGFVIPLKTAPAGTLRGQWGQVFRPMAGANGVRSFIVAFLPCRWYKSLNGTSPPH